MDEFDVVIAGSGNAALTAAARAAESGARALVVEKAPEAEAEGNSRFAGGVYRAAYERYDDVHQALPDLTHEAWEAIAAGSYDHNRCRNDIARMCGEESVNWKLTEVYIDHSMDTLEWMVGLGVRFMLAGTDAYGRVSPGAAIWAEGEGRAVVASLMKACDELGVMCRFETQAVDLVEVDGAVAGLRCRLATGEETVVNAGAVILACGGFEASQELRAR